MTTRPLPGWVHVAGRLAPATRLTVGGGRPVLDTPDGQVALTRTGGRWASRGVPVPPSLDSLIARLHGKGPATITLPAPTAAPLPSQP